MNSTLITLKLRIRRVEKEKKRIALGRSRMQKRSEAIETAQETLLKYLHDNGEIPDSGKFAESVGIEHTVLDSVIKSLHGFRLVDAQVFLPIIQLSFFFFFLLFQWFSILYIFDKKFAVFLCVVLC